METTQEKVNGQTQWFVLLDSFNKPANALQKEVLEFLQREDRRLITNAEAYKIFIINEIKMMNIKNKRCRPLNPSFFSPYKGDYSLSMNDFLTSYSVRFRLIKCK